MNTIDAKLLQKAFLSGAKNLEAKKEWINELNVFPVPDGDTGTNMSLTIMAAAKEVAAIEQPTMETLAKAMSSGSLRGARGNSGVILSQLFRGFTKEIKTVETIDTKTLASAFIRASETAYKAVMKPKEGTILTVAREMAEKAAELSGETTDILELCRLILEHGDEVLSQTPEMLPVLKQAGVVDSGGQGLMEVLRGCFDGLMGKEIDLSVITPAKRPQVDTAAMDKARIDTADITFGYCTEFIIQADKEFTFEQELELKQYLSEIGDSLVVVADEEIVKVHVHTNHPGLAFEKGLTYGSLSRMKVDNMREEHEERLIKDAEKIARENGSGVSKTELRKPYGFLAVSVGKGLGEIFKGIGADRLIEGGQTMNPSTDDILQAVDQVNADTIFIFPNNKNIILAAEQAARLSKDKKLIVVPTKTVPQGVTALINFIPDLSGEENLANMKEEMQHVKTASITYAVRTTTIDGMDISQGDIMAIGDKGMLAVTKNIQDAAMKALAAMIDKDSELVTIYYGEQIQKQDAENLLGMAKDKFPHVEIELQDGGQPVYYYLLSVE